MARHFYIILFFFSASTSNFYREQKYLVLHWMPKHFTGVCTEYYCIYKPLWTTSHHREGLHTLYIPQLTIAARSSINLFEVWREQKKRGYFKFGNLLIWVSADKKWANLKYALSFCSRYTLNRLIISMSTRSHLQVSKPGNVCNIYCYHERSLIQLPCREFQSFQRVLMENIACPLIRCYPL